MINLNDLMIGSYVYPDAETNEIKEVVELSKRRQIVGLNDVNTFLRRGVVRDIGHVRPVPITPEILERLGFKNFYAKNNKHKISIINFGDVSVDVFPKTEFWGIFVSSKSSAGGFTIGVNHVHELQNLVYALTKRELTLDGGELCK